MWFTSSSLLAYCVMQSLTGAAFDGSCECLSSQRPKGNCLPGPFRAPSCNGRSPVITCEPLARAFRAPAPSVGRLGRTCAHAGVAQTGAPGPRFAALESRVALTKYMMTF